MNWEFLSLVSVLILVSSTFKTWSEAKNETIIKVPYKNEQSVWTWSWTNQWTTRNDEDGKALFYVCDKTPHGDPNKWIRSNKFLVGDAKRIDVTVKYGVIKCSSLPLIQQCKEKLKLHVFKTAEHHTLTTNKVPEPWKNPEVYHIFGTLSPANLSSGGFLRSFTNTETHSFFTNSSTPYHYFAVQYQGGCFELYSVTISYSVCPSLFLPILLPRTVAPVNGAQVQVQGSCSKNAEPADKNVPIYGHCQANGEWSGTAMSGKCLCKSGYGKYLNGSDAVCKDCPHGTFQDTPSESACKACPLNSVQDLNRMRCNCASSFYRTKDQTIFDNCDAQPSAPRDFRATFLNATTAIIQWKTPSNLGGRKDMYYELQCQKCDNEGKNCSLKCATAKITHSPRHSSKATVKHLSAYAYYQFKVFAKNGVTHLAEKNGEKPKYAVVTKRTGESVPGSPVLKIVFMSPTSVLLSWTLTEKNGEITYYQVIYYPVKDKSSRYIFNTSENSLTINGLDKGTEYHFEVRAATKLGVGSVGSTQIAITKGKGGDTNIPTNGATNTIVAVLASIVVVGLLTIVVFILRKRRVLHPSEETVRYVPGNRAHNTDISPADPSEEFTDQVAINDPEETSIPRNESNVPYHIPDLDVSEESTEQAAVPANHFEETTNPTNEQNMAHVPSDTRLNNVTEEPTNQVAIPVSRSQTTNPTNEHNASDLHDPIWEVPRENLTLENRLGEGHFGFVHKARAIGLRGCPGQVIVAVKTLKDNADEIQMKIGKRDFLNELKLMKKLEPHPHVVKLLGCCTRPGEPMCIILEYHENGDLLGYLKRLRNSVTSQDLIHFAWMTADGMSFLADKMIIHRDLAARNILVGENKICKISDLGLAREIRVDTIYVKKTEEAMLPTRWMPPESILENKSSIASDVWSYGIVLWEIFTLGVNDIPYPTMSFEVLREKLKRKEGYRMPKPAHISETLYSLMLRCWKKKPEERPSFREIRKEIRTFYKDAKSHINLDIFDEASQVNAEVC